MITPRTWEPSFSRSITKSTVEAATDSLAPTIEPPLSARDSRVARGPGSVRAMTESQREPVPRVDETELDTALAFLDFARSSVLKKARDLAEEDLHRAMLPTGTSILRLIRHLTDGERYWFVVQLTGLGEEPDWDLADVDRRPAAEIIEDYRAAITASNRAVREIGDPSAPAARDLDGQRMSLRWTLAHMTSETARHAGHADAVRELIDGTTGR